MVIIVLNLSVCQHYLLLLYIAYKLWYITLRKIKNWINICNFFVFSRFTVFIWFFTLFIEKVLEPKRHKADYFISSFRLMQTKRIYARWMKNNIKLNIKRKFLTPKKRLPHISWTITYNLSHIVTCRVLQQTNIDTLLLLLYMRLKGL